MGGGGSAVGQGGSAFTRGTAKLTGDTEPPEDSLDLRPILGVGDPAEVVDGLAGGVMGERRCLWRGGDLVSGTGELCWRPRLLPRLRHCC